MLVAAAAAAAERRIAGQPAEPLKFEFVGPCQKLFEVLLVHWQY